VQPQACARFRLAHLRMFQPSRSRRTENECGFVTAKMKSISSLQDERQPASRRKMVSPNGCAVLTLRPPETFLELGPTLACALPAQPQSAARLRIRLATAPSPSLLSMTTFPLFSPLARSPHWPGVPGSNGLCKRWVPCKYRRHHTRPIVGRKLPRPRIVERRKCRLGAELW
jgi:hypothetical protein